MLDRHRMMHYKTGLLASWQEVVGDINFFLAIEIFLGYKSRLVLA
jgi:hypothetical protein